MSSLEAIRNDITVFRKVVSSYPAESHRQFSFLMGQVQTLCSAYEYDREKMHQMLQQSLEAFQFQLMDVEKDNRRQSYELEGARKTVSRLRSCLPELASSVHALQPELRALRGDLLKSLEEANSLFLSFAKAVKSNSKLGSRPRESASQGSHERPDTSANQQAHADGPGHSLLNDLNLKLQESQLKCKRAEFQVCLVPHFLLLFVWFAVPVVGKRVSVRVCGIRKGGRFEDFHRLEGEDCTSSIIRFARFTERAC